MELPPPADPRELFDEAVARLEIVSADAAPGLRWSLPECELRYAFDAKVTVRSPIRESEGGLAIRGTILMGHEGERATLQNGPIEVGTIRNGQVQPGRRQAAASLATVYLALVGRGLREVDGPTSLFSAYGEQWKGPVIYFPSLPDPSLSSETEWRIQTFPRGSATETEGRRGSLALPDAIAPPSPLPEESSATVRVDRWVRVGEHHVALLTAEWDIERSRSLSVPTKASGSIDRRTRGHARGHYAVLDTGWLLHAGVASVTETRLTSNGEGAEQRHTEISSMRLIESCQGPTLAPFPEPEETFERRAIEAYTELRNAAAATDRARLAAHLSPALRAAHGETALTNALITHLREWGPVALGSPELSHAPPSVEGNQVTLRFVGSIRAPDEVTPVELELRARIDRNAVHFEHIGISSGDSGFDVLEVSETRLHRRSPLGPGP